MSSTELLTPSVMSTLWPLNPGSRRTGGRLGSESGSLHSVMSSLLDDDDRSYKVEKSMSL